MSYDPSHRKRPPRQARSPHATPPEPWQAYREGDAYPREVQAGVDNQRSYWATAAAGSRSQPVYQDASVGPATDRGYHRYQPPGGPDPFAGAVSDYDQRGYGYDDAGADYDDAGAGQGGVGVGYQEPQDGFDGAPVGPSRTAVGYAGVQEAYSGARNGYLDTRGGYAPAPDDLAGGPYGHGGALDDFPGDEFAAGDYPRDYPGVARSGAALAAPDADVYPDSWQAEQDARREADRRGLAVGALTGLLATAAAIGVSTLAAAFVRPQASPMTALGNVFIDRTPTALRTLAAAHFGSHDRAVLLLGMYVVIGCLALGIGVLARRAAALGMAGLAAFSLVGAFVVITRPGGRLSDIFPSVVGGLVGVAAILWLRHASAPITPTRPARGRRTR
jgi:hypothetical protein